MTNQATIIERRSTWEINGWIVAATKPISAYRAEIHRKQAFRGIAKNGGVSLSGSITEIDHSTYTWSAKRV